MTGASVVEYLDSLFIPDGKTDDMYLSWYDSLWATSVPPPRLFGSLMISKTKSFKARH